MNKPTLEPHIYRQFINELRDEIPQYHNTQQLRAKLESIVRKYIEPEHGKEGNCGSR